MGDCYFSGVDYGAGVEVYFWLEVIVSNGLLRCSDTETCEEWTVDTEGFYEAVDFTITTANPGLLCGVVRVGMGVPLPRLGCPLIFATDISTRYLQYRNEALATAEAYIESLTPEQRAALCEAYRGS